MMNDDDDSMLPHVDAPLDNSSVPGTRYHVNYTASAHFPETYEPVARRKTRKKHFRYYKLCCENIGQGTRQPGTYVLLSVQNQVQ